MRPRILDEAEVELTHAAQDYESRRSGLGHLFLDQFLDSVNEIEKHPRRFPRYDTPRSREIRRYLLPTFPYAVVFEMIDDDAVILAVAHGARKPGYWKKRGTSHS